MTEKPEGLDESVENEADSEKESSAPRWARKFQAKLDSVEKPKKITRDDVLDRWDDTYEQRQHALNNVKKPSSIAKIVTGVAVVATLIMGLGATSDNNHFKTESAQNKEQISSLNTQLASAKSDTTKVPKHDDAAKFITDANTQGQAVAKIQNQMIAEFPKHNADKMASFSDQMAKHMTQSTMIATGQWYTIDPTKGNKYASTKYAWEFQTPYAFDNNGLTVRVVWLCRDTRTKQLLAWAIGDYSSETKKFQGVIWGKTDEGTKRIGTPIDNDGSGKTDQKKDHSLDDNIPTK